MATGWKRHLERMLVGSGAAHALSRRHRPSATILAYHNIVPRGEPLAGDASLHVDQGTFADQLDFVAEHCDVVALSELLLVEAERSRVAITFDDAYQGTMTVGLHELGARGLPATVFAPPGLLGTDGFWWDQLAPPGGGPLPAEVRNHALWRLEGRQERVLAWAAEQGLPRAALPTHACPVDETTLVGLARQEGITVAAHTWSHPNLAAVPDALACEELERSRKWLQARAPRYIDWLAYPYGLRTDAVVARAGESFEGAVLIEGGLAQSRGRWLTSCHAIPRLNVPRGLTLEGLALRLAGLRR